MLKNFRVNNDEIYIRVTDSRDLEAFLLPVLRFKECRCSSLLLHEFSFELLLWLTT